MSEIEIRLALAERALEDIKHRARNDRQIASLLEDELDHARREIVAIKARLYAGVGVALVLGPLFAWFFDALR